MKKSFLCLLFICLAFSLLNSSCKKADEAAPRAYFTYRIGYYERTDHPSGPVEQCITGDGVCDFVLQPDWRLTGPMPDGYGFGYLTLTSKLKIRMVIYMPFLSTQTYREHYADQVASLPGPWKLAIELTTKLGIVDGYTVSMGDYKVGLGTEDGYEVLIIEF